MKGDLYRPNTLVAGWRHAWEGWIHLSIITKVYAAGGYFEPLGTTTEVVLSV